MRFISYLLFVMLLLSSRAFADMSDDEYVTKYFGTQLLLHSASQIYDPNVGWWTDLLPPLIFDASYVSGLVNGRRIDKGIKDMLDPMQSIVVSGAETPVDNGYVYDISFIDMRPSEVQNLISALGGLDAAIPGVTMEFAPVTTKYFYFSTQDLDGKLSVKVGNSSLEIGKDMSAGDIHKRLVELFTEVYGMKVDIDLYFSQSITSYGNSLDVSLTAYLGGAPTYDESYEGDV